jgi:hypothetical protein
MVTFGFRELVYFLSRLPKSKNLGDWRYDPRADCWISGAHRMKVCTEATQSIEACLYSGLTKEEIGKFVEDNKGE